MAKFDKENDDERIELFKIIDALANDIACHKHEIEDLGFVVSYRDDEGMIRNHGEFLIKDYYNLLGMLESLKLDIYNAEEEQDYE